MNVTAKYGFRYPYVLYTITGSWEVIKWLTALGLGTGSFMNRLLICIASLLLHLCL